MNNRSFLEMYAISARLEKKIARKNQHLSFNHKGVLYSYSTPIAFYNKDRFIVSSVNYSRTTARHLTMLKGILSMFRYKYISAEREIREILN